MNCTRGREERSSARLLSPGQSRTPGQLAIAWVLARQPGFVPVVGAKTVAQLEDSLGALSRTLSKADLAALDSIVTISGERYGAEQMKHLDSERSAHP
ncbi:MAG TPA: aldo/keto reductase [Archangium sp.]|uniref:aldo/keto reductase n=1 Tax=Archangium sp. TaxID=1872627 RepID=UPI002E31006E|nr:aldo/keto reductase [Archangium sp.]HEX5752695.1 aldo/keto reductase [Archangium sp.]